MKIRVREWNRAVFGWIDLKVEEDVDNINMLDNLLVENMGGEVEDLINFRREVSKEMWSK